MKGPSSYPCCRLFEQTFFDNVTKNGDIRVRDGHLSLLTATTPPKYDTVWKQEFVRIGFTNRIWLVWETMPMKQVSLPGAMFERDKVDFFRLVEDRLLDVIVAPNPRVMVLSTDARARWDEWYSGLQRSIHTVRLDTYGWRLMMLLAIARGEEEVSEDTVGRVCALLDHQLLLRQQHDPLDAENAMAEMEQRLRRILSTKGPQTERDLRRFSHAERKGMWMFKTALENLRNARQVIWDGQIRKFRLG